MSERITGSQKELMYYRQILLTDRLNKVCAMINGRGCGFYPFITDERGKVTDESLGAFIPELIACGERCSGKAYEKGSRELFRNFLYCAMASMKCTVNRRCPSVVSMAPASTFADIIEFAEYLRPSGGTDYEDFLAWEYARYRQDKDKTPEMSYFFDCASESLNLMGYDYFARYLPKETQLRLCKEYAQRHNIPPEENRYYIGEANGVFDTEEFSRWEEKRLDELEKDAPEEPDDSQYEDLAKELEERDNAADALDGIGEEGSYADSELLRGFTPEQLLETEKYKAERDMLGAAREHRNIIDLHRIVESYDAFSRAYFSMGCPDIAGDIRNMADTFLFENKLSAFALGDDYGLITYDLDRMRSRIAADIERSRAR